MVEMYETWQGWVIRRKDNNRWIYVSGYKNGEYKWVLDYLYSKKFRLVQTALKHFRIINSCSCNRKRD